MLQPIFLAASCYLPLSLFSTHIVAIFVVVVAVVVVVVVVFFGGVGG